ncbi:MAG: hypothetical protein D6763_10475 [Alphaproteobacteria bacterium]|nr:MAG: hypothetical protein D6763_10475 [Alphaproteobacteria bacterium]
MSKITCFVILAGAVFATPALADPAMGGGHGRHVGHHGMNLMMMDTDEDRTISRDEFDAHHAEKFKAADADGDGKVTKEEFAAFFEAERERRRAMMRDRMFSYADADGDGVITAEESKANGARMFERMDHNRDGKLDRSDRRKKGHGKDPMKSCDDEGPEGAKTR